MSGFFFGQSSRWVRWSYCSTTAKKLGSVQVRMFALLTDAKPLPLEPYEEFCKRRLRQAGAVCSRHGRFSQQWAFDMVKWHNHVTRAHDSNSWNNMLLQYKNKSFIDTLRSCCSSGIRSSRINSCIHIGGVVVRWESGLLEAQAFLNENPIQRHSISQLENVPVTQTAVLEQLEALLRHVDN